MLPYPSGHKLGKDETHKLEDSDWLAGETFCEMRIEIEEWGGRRKEGGNGNGLDGRRKSQLPYGEVTKNNKPKCEDFSISHPLVTHYPNPDPKPSSNPILDVPAADPWAANVLAAHKRIKIYISISRRSFLRMVV